MPITPEINGASIILNGSFNPVIFQPEWFARQNLLPEKELEGANIKMIMPQVCEFETERFIIQVTNARFSAACKASANPAMMKDLVLGTFFILDQTPISAAGLNREMHFAMASEEVWNRVGDRLAPKDGWSKILRGRPGMKALWIQAEIPDFPNLAEGRLLVRVEPSASVKWGVFLQANEHYEAPKENGTKFLVDKIKSRWEGAYSYAAEIADCILTWASQ